MPYNWDISSDPSHLYPQPQPIRSKYRNINIFIDSNIHNLKKCWFLFGSSNAFLVVTNLSAMFDTWSDLTDKHAQKISGTQRNLVANQVNGLFVTFLISRHPLEEILFLLVPSVTKFLRVSQKTNCVSKDKF
jgi:hypothetical protein